MLILITFRISNGGRTTFKTNAPFKENDELTIIGYVIGHQTSISLKIIFKKKITEDIIPRFFKFSRICPLKLHDSELWLIKWMNRDLALGLFFSPHINENVSTQS